MPKAKQLTAHVEDRAGILGEVASTLGAKKINIVGFMAVVAPDGGVIRMVVDKPAAARKVLAQHGWQTTEEDVVQATLADKPGTMGSVTGKLGAAGINIQYAYTGTARSAAKVNLFLAVTDVAAALKALR